MHAAVSLCEVGVCYTRSCLVLRTVCARRWCVMTCVRLNAMRVRPCFLVHGLCTRQLFPSGFPLASVCPRVTYPWPVVCGSVSIWSVVQAALPPHPRLEGRVSSGGGTQRLFLQVTRSPIKGSPIEQNKSSPFPSSSILARRTPTLLPPQLLLWPPQEASPWECVRPLLLLPPLPPPEKPAPAPGLG